jgi:molybdenum cofactor cytidylyltransferase
MTYSLLTAFGLGDKPELIALVGGGGKTSLLFALAKVLPGRVVVTTTTRIFAAQMKLATAVLSQNNLHQLSQKLDEHRICLVIGEVQGDKAVGVTPALPGQLLARSDVDFVLVEADGSRMRPIKAPAPHEPVIPPETTLVVPVVGIDALNGRIEDVAHRPELVRAVIGNQLSVIGNQYSVSSDQLSVEDVAALLAHPQGGMKGVPEGARVIPLINKVETEEQLLAARQIAHHTLRSAPYALHAVVIGAVKTPHPIREVHQQVTAVILAAGEGKRMRQTKQLLPWGQTTVLAQTIGNVKNTAVHHHLLISGHEADKIEAIAAAEGVSTIHNPQYATGEMLSSLQTAIPHLSPQTAAILVMLGDQPMVAPEAIDRLLVAFWQGQGEIVAPVFEGKRGNPVLIGRSHFAALLALPPGDAPRTLLQQHPVYLVEMATDSVLRDLDKPEQYDRDRPNNKE